MSGSNTKPLHPMVAAMLKRASMYDRSAEPCDDCGEPSGRTFYPPDVPVRCSQCFCKRLSAKRAAARDDRLKEAK